MSIAEYISERKKTKTYEAGLLIFKKYNIESKWYSLRAVFPVLPNADDEYHILVMSFKSIHPSITTVLTNKKEKDNAIEKDELDKYLFIFVKIKSQILAIPSPADGYQLGDGYTIHTDIEVEYKINNAKKFWLYADDPLDLFQRIVVNEAKQYFFSTDSSYLLEGLGNMKRNIEQFIKHYTIDVNSSESGISIMNVYADIKLCSNSKEYFKRKHEKKYSPGGLFEKGDSQQQESLFRMLVNKEIENDLTFFPYTIKQVILALDTGLLEYFYTLPRSEAMQKVHDEIRRKKNSYLSDHKKSKIEGIIDFIRVATANGFEPEQIDMLRDKLLKEMQNDHENNTPLFTDKKFIEMIISSQQSQQYIDDHTSSAKEDTP